jgi:hypothetical protein
MRELLKVNLNNLMPTADELKESRMQLQQMNEKQRSSKEAGLRAYMKLNPDGESDKSRGQCREEVLLKFMVVQQRTKDATSKNLNEKTISKSLEKIHDMEWMSKEQGQGKYGTQKFQHWLDSTLLPERGDRLTGCKDEWVIEYACPNEIQRFTESDIKAFKQRVEADMAKDDATAMDELMNKSTAEEMAAPTAEPSKPVEPTLSPVERHARELERAIESLKSNMKQTMAKYTNIELTCELQVSAAEAKLNEPGEKKIANYVRELIKDIKATCKKIKKLKKCLTIALTAASRNEEIDDAVLPEVLANMRIIDDEVATNDELASQFGCQVELKGKGKSGGGPAKKKRRKEE